MWPFKKKQSRLDTASGEIEINVPHGDGWVNALSGIGSTSYDKRLSSLFSTDVLTEAECIDLWRGNDLAARIIETPVNEMLRQGWDLTIKDDDSKDLQEEVMSKAEDLGVAESFWEALSAERGLGGAAILLGINDGSRSLAEPLNLDRIRSFDWLTVLEPSELTPVKWYANPRAGKFGKPAIYQMNARSPGIAIDPVLEPPLAEIHESRLIIFPGIRVSRQQTAVGGWQGDSCLVRANPILRDFGVSWDAACILLHDFAQAIYKVKGLSEMMSQDRDDEFKARVKAVELSRSIARAVFIDSEEEFERKTTQLTGMPEMLNLLATRLAAAADQPVTLLMGMSPGGLNATGESDIRFFYDRMRSGQDRKVRPPLERVYQLILLSLLTKEPRDWGLKFRPLWQTTDKEQAETRKIVAETDQIYVTIQAASPMDVAKSRWGGDGYSTEMTVDLKEIERLSQLPEVDPYAEDEKVPGDKKIPADKDGE